MFNTGLNMHLKMKYNSIINTKQFYNLIIQKTPMIHGATL